MSEQDQKVKPVVLYFQNRCVCKVLVGIKPSRPIVDSHQILFLQSIPQILSNQSFSWF